MVISIAHMPITRGSLLIEHIHPLLRVDETIIEKLAYRLIQGEQKTLSYVGIILAGHETVLALNRKYLSHDYCADVLSFSYDEDNEKDVLDGEVYVDLDTAKERHVEFGTSFEEEAYRYVIHGLLHLAGYDDATQEGRVNMQTIENRYLKL